MRSKLYILSKTVLTSPLKFISRSDDRDNTHKKSIFQNKETSQEEARDSQKVRNISLSFHAVISRPYTHK